MPSLKPLAALLALSAPLFGCQVFQSKTNTFVQKDKTTGKIQALLLPYNDTIADATPANPDVPPITSAPSTGSSVPGTGDNSNANSATASLDISAGDTADAVTTAFKKMGQCWYLVKASDKSNRKIDIENINLSLPADQADAIEGAELVTKNYVPTPALIGAMKRDPLLRNMRAQYDNTLQRMNEASQRNFSQFTSNPLYVATIGGTIGSSSFLNDRLGNLSAESLLAGKSKALEFWSQMVEKSALSRFKSSAIVSKLAGPRKILVDSAFGIFDKAHQFCFRNTATSRIMGLACVTGLVTVVSAAIQGSVNLWTEKTERPPPLFKAEKAFLDEFASAISDIEKEAAVSADELNALIRAENGKTPDGVLRRLGKRPGAPCPSASQAARNMRVAAGLEQ
jgi:hypothetical protein